MEDCTELKAELQLLRSRVARLEDQQAVRALQFKYGYYMDKCLFGDIVELFAEDATLYFLNGIFAAPSRLVLVATRLAASAPVN